MKRFPDTLMLFSGGLDSTFCLWQRVQRGELTRVQHVIYKDARHGRQDVEAAAVRNVLAWMYDHGGRGLIDYSESSVDMGSMWTPLGCYQWAYWAGAIVSHPAGLYRAIVQPICADDHEIAMERFDTAFRTTIQLMAGRVPELLYPIRSMTKRQMIAELPAELLRLCWWCQRPWHGRPCHHCDSCELMDAALRESPCTLPPPGWACSLHAGHDGPCAGSRQAPPPEAS